MSNTEQIWNLFLDLTKHLEEIDKKENGSRDWNHVYDTSLSSYRLLNNFPNASHGEVNRNTPLKVMPLIDEEKEPYYRTTFKNMVKPTSRYNAYAFIGIGHRFDRYYKFGPTSGIHRLEAAQKNIYPKFVKDMNSFLNTQKINERALKAKIVNGTFNNTWSMENFPYDKYWGETIPSYYQTIVPIAIQISYASN